MSKVLERKMFAKTAKKFAKGGEVTPQEPAFDMEAGMVPRSQRERMASELLGRDLGYSLLAQGDRPMLTRPTATGGGIPMAMQPQQAPVAAQMQQLQRAGMLPGFAEGGPVEEPSIWSRIRTSMGNAIGMRGRPDPIFARGSGPQIGGITPSVSQERPLIYADGTQPVADGLGFPMSDLPPAPGGGQSISLGGITQVPGALLGRPQFAEPTPPSEAEQAAMEADRESRRGAGFRKIEPPKAPAEEPKKQAPPPPPPGGGKSSDMSDIKAEREAKAALAKQENMWLALMQAGLAIAGGRSPNAITNIGQGGQAGLASFMALEQQRRKDEDAAVRRDIAEKEYRLQERRLRAMEPVYAGQAAYYASRPLRDAQVLAGQQAVARQRAATEAGRLWKEETKGNPAYVGKSEDQLKIQRDIFIKRETDRLTNAYLNDILYGSPGQSRAPAAPEE